jgi:CrcB protein
MTPPPGWSAPLLVALGAVPGAWLRHRLVSRLAPCLPRRHWGTLVVNLLACLALGLLVAAGMAARPAMAWELLLATGFLGSFSTFSTLAAELQSCLAQGQRREALALTLTSLVGGLVALRLGQLLGELLKESWFLS